VSGKLPTIGVVTTATNSFSRGYLAYLACIDAWSKWADQIVIVDGGTTDESYDLLKHWGAEGIWNIYHSPQTLWGTGGRWHAAQWTINTNAGLARLDTDWAFVISSDYVLDLATTKRIRQLLGENQDAYCATYQRVKLYKDGHKYLTKLPGFAINIKKFRAEGIDIGFGISRENDQPSDAPIYLQEQTQFIDPANCSTKTAFRGNLVPVNLKLDLTSVVYGHFFFNFAQVLDKLVEYYQIYRVRYAKRLMKNREMFVTEYGLLHNGGILSKEAELAKPHSHEIKKVIDQFYQCDMLGHGSGKAEQRLSITHLSNWFRQKVNNTFFQLSSFPSVQRSQRWYAMGNQSALPLDIKELYRQQDRYLPHDVRINWADQTS